MYRRRVTRTLGVAAGGLLGAAFLPAALALADDYDIVPVPGSTETVTGLYGLEITASPDEAGSVQGYQEFEVLDTTTGSPVGTFDADEANVTDSLGETNQELLVTNDLTGTVGTAAGDTPAVGSVIDTYGDTGFGYMYSDLAATTPGGADTITDTLVTPLGDFTIPTTFDAVAGLASDSSDAALQDITLAGGYEIVPATGSTEALTAISGLPPYDVAVQGTQLYDVENASGTVVGSFDGDVTSTSDAVGFSTQALLVTSDVSGTAGTAAGDVPAVGSVFNTIDYGDPSSTPIYTDAYSDLTSATPGGADDITNTIDGSTIPTTFDAAAAESPSLAIPVGGDGDTIVADPGSTEVFTGVNGLPPYDVAVQGTQEFDVDNASGTVVGTFDADVVTSSDSQGPSTETLLVTSDVTGTPGTAAGDVPQVGSLFDAYGDSGFETVYSDLVSTTGGANTTTETFVTPFGNFTVPDDTFDASAAVAGDQFQNVLPGATSAAADPLSSLDLSGAVDTGAFADLFPHLDAALNLLTGLF